MKIKQVVLSLLFIVVTTNLFAQDTIYFTNGKLVIAKVELIDYKNIYYKRYDYINGPSYRVFRNEVEKVVFADGYVEKITEIQNAEFLKNNSNLIGINFLNLILGQAYIFYECQLIKKFSLRVPLYFGTREGPNTFWDKININYSLNSGLELIHYPTKNNEIYLGLSTRVGQKQISYLYKQFVGVDSFGNNKYNYSSVLQNNLYTIVSAIAGINVKFSNSFSIYLQSGIGTYYYHDGYYRGVFYGSKDKKHYVSPYFQFGIMPVYRF